MRNLRLDICYEGSRYRGWQRLPGTDNTIQGKIETALSRILDEPIEIVGSGRTDAGTHARMQVANFHCNSTMPADEILAQLRRYLPEDIGIYCCRNVSPRFHARLNAKTKTYQYRIWNSEEPCVFDRKFVHVDPRPVDLAMMHDAARYFLGEHDFSALCFTINGSAINYGSFLEKVIDFLVVALCIFVFIKLINNVLKKKEEAKEEVKEEPKKSDEVLLLEDIRDLLKKQK